MVNCRLEQSILTCTSSNRIIQQFCNINGGPAENCAGSFDITSFGLATGMYNLTIFFTDAFGQVLDIHRQITITASGMGNFECIALNFQISLSPDFTTSRRLSL